MIIDSHELLQSCLIVLSMVAVFRTCSGWTWSCAAVEIFLLITAFDVCEKNLRNTKDIMKHSQPHEVGAATREGRGAAVRHFSCFEEARTDERWRIGCSTIQSGVPVRQ